MLIAHLLGLPYRLVNPVKVALLLAGLNQQPVHLAHCSMAVQHIICVTDTTSGVTGTSTLRGLDTH